MSETQSEALAALTQERDALKAEVAQLKDQGDRAMFREQLETELRRRISDQAAATSAKVLSQEAVR